MNPSTIFTLMFAFLSIPSTATKASDEVVDWSGQPLMARVSYDMWGVGLWRGPIAMGTTVEQGQNINYVINKPHRETDPFLPDPVIFYPANKSETLVRVGQDYNIVFQDFNSVWTVNDDRVSNNRNFITTGGQKDNRGCLNIYSWFQFELVDDNEHLYKLINYPQVCFPSRNPTEVTSIWKDGEDRLYLNKDNTVQNSAINLRFVEHRVVIQQVVEMNSWLQG